jgi:hypothetical protein
MQNTWKIIEGFGRTHLMIPQGKSTVCRYFPNLNGDVTEITNIRENVSCAECLKFARDLCIPTA